MTIPPGPGFPPVYIPDTLHIEEIVGDWTITDQDGNDVSARGYACSNKDNIQGCITYHMHDSVPFDQRDAVVQIRIAYSWPDGSWEEMGGGDFYELAVVGAGENSFQVCGGIRGHTSPDPFHFHEDLIPGSYGVWLSADLHFRLTVNTIFDWHLAKTIEVFPCPDTPNVPILTTIPMPPNPMAGDKIHDTAQLLGGIEPTGDITFRLWGDDDETELIYEEIVDVHNNGTYETQEVDTPVDVPYPDGIHWHWKAHYSGDGNNEAVDSGNEPVDIEPILQFPSSIDTFAFTDLALNEPGTVGERIPGIARFQQIDLGQLWFTETKTDTNTVIDEEDRSPVGPSLDDHVAIGGQNYIIEIIDQDGNHVYNITPPVDYQIRPMQYIMGVCYNWKNGDLYAALTYDPVALYTPHDVDWFPDDSGILAAVVVGAQVVHFRKYDYSGNLLWDVVPDVEEGWWLQPVKIAISCDSKFVYYTFQGNRIKRYNLETFTQEDDYLTLPSYSGYLYGDLQILRGSGERTALVVTMTRSGQGPHRGVAVAPRYFAWNDRDNPVDTIYKAEKRRLSDLELVLAIATGDGDKILSMACNYNPCQVQMPVIVTLIS